MNSSSLRLLRIIRISRLARVARILRSVPEMMTPSFTKKTSALPGQSALEIRSAALTSEDPFPGHGSCLPLCDLHGLSSGHSGLCFCARLHATPQARMFRSCVEAGKKGLTVRHTQGHGCGRCVLPIDYQGNAMHSARLRKHRHICRDSATCVHAAVSVRFALFFHGCLGEFLPNLAEAVFDEGVAALAMSFGASVSVLCDMPRASTPAGIDVGFFLILFVFLGPLTVPTPDAVVTVVFCGSRTTYGQVMNMVVAVLVHVVSSVATLQQKNQHNGQSLSQLRQIPLSATLRLHSGIAQQM